MRRLIPRLLDRLLGCKWDYYLNPYRTDVRQCSRCHRVAFL
jgi:hypothetical protein